MNKDSKPKLRSPVKKNMDKFHKPKTHRDKTKYWRKGLNLPANELPEVFDKDTVMQYFEDTLLDKSLYEPEQEDKKEDT